MTFLDFLIQWNIKEKQAECGNVLCGLVLDPELAFNVLDRGPAADTPEVSHDKLAPSTNGSYLLAIFSFE